MANVPAPLGKMMDTVRGFTVAQRTIMIIGVAILVMGAVALSTFLSQPKMTPLFSGLAPEDAAGIVEQLKSDGVSYELTGGGGTILVPEGSVYEARLKAAASGLPSSGTSGYSLLDQMGVTSSEFQQSVTYKRALEGELANTIQAMDGVKLASVKLAIPEQTVFVDSKTNPTASIFVETKPGVTLSRDQVQSVVHLTSAAVDGLKPDDVSVVDSAGNLLSAAGVGLTGGVNQQTSDYETRVASSIQGMLDRVVGPGNATVAVAAEMSKESAERTEETFTDPKGSPALVESEKKEDYKGNGNGGPAAGVLGPDNIAVPNGTNGTGTFTSTDNQRTNAVNKVTENRTIPAGTLQRQTISVALSDKAAQGLSIPQLTQMISNAAGVDTNRNDQVSVSVVPFNTDAATAAQNQLAAADAAETAARNAALMRTLIIAGVVALALILIAAYALYVRRNKQNREPIDLGELRDYPSLSAVPMETPNPETVALTQVVLPPPVATFPISHNVKREELSALAASDPAKMAEYLRTVMDDRKHE
ncbi:flagellar basal-body MS-ring/collar protein FliF [Paeniglutamicibacter sp. NPDC012692]|uniref:flagellar basal-body MS-ring/collar protein FliF n=1 Tax=Paeniglutamicibacter sp. NPDC012692 TaxID=3364388 RepID=UPI00367843CC